MRLSTLVFTLIVFKLSIVRVPLALGAAPEVDQNWEVLNDDEDVTVYRSVKAQDHIFTFRGVGLVAAPIPKILALMSDARRLPEWVYNCSEGELVERNFKESDRLPDPNAYYQIFYGVTALPWPLRPRDYVLKAQVSYALGSSKTQPKNVTIAMQSVQHPMKPEMPGRVRMPRMESLIVMTPEGEAGSKTWIDFSVTSNPGGVVPAWIAKIASRDIPRRTVVSLRKLVASEVYNKEMEELVQYYYRQEQKRANP